MDLVHRCDVVGLVGPIVVRATYRYWTTGTPMA